MSSNPSDPTPQPTPEERAALLVEYDAAQSSAQHHDSMLWSATYTIWTGVLILLGLTLNVADKPALRVVVVVFSLIGVVLTWAVEVFARDFRSIKNQKYERCRSIEQRLGYMRQHTDVITPRGKQARIYLAITALLSAAWILVSLASLLQ